MEHEKRHCSEIYIIQNAFMQKKKTQNHWIFSIFRTAINDGFQNVKKKTQFDFIFNVIRGNGLI